MHKKRLAKSRSSMRTWAVALAGAVFGLGLVFDRETQAALPEGFTVRAGADVTIPLFLATGDDHPFPDRMWLGIDVAPGYKILPVLTLEAVFTPMIPLVKGPGTEFNFTIGPSAHIDLYLVYLRAALPIEIVHGEVLVQGAAGLSFLGKGYFGAKIDYWLDSKIVSLGGEVGWRF